MAADQALAAAAADLQPIALQAQVHNLTEHVWKSAHHHQALAVVLRAMAADQALAAAAADLQPIALQAQVHNLTEHA